MKKFKNAKLTPQQIQFLFTKTTAVYKQVVRVVQMEERASASGNAYFLAHVQWSNGTRVSSETAYVTAQAAGDLDSVLIDGFYEIEYVKIEGAPYQDRNGGVRTNVRHNILSFTAVGADE